MQRDPEVKFQTNLGKRIRELRITRGLTQEDFEDHTELSVTTRALQNIEYGRSNPRIYTLYKIASRLEIAVDELLRFGSS